jgi:hypothetical protein
MQPQAHAVPPVDPPNVEWPCGAVAMSVMVLVMGAMWVMVTAVATATAPV